MSDNDENLTVGVSEYASQEAFQLIGAGNLQPAGRAGIVWNVRAMALRYAVAASVD